MSDAKRKVTCSFCGERHTISNCDEADRAWKMLGVSDRTTQKQREAAFAKVREQYVSEFGEERTATFQKLFVSVGADDIPRVKSLKADKTCSICGGDANHEWLANASPAARAKNPTGTHTATTCPWREASLVADRVHGGIGNERGVPSVPFLRSFYDRQFAATRVLMERYDLTDDQVDINGFRNAVENYLDSLEGATESINTAMITQAKEASLKKLSAAIQSATGQDIDPTLLSQALAIARERQAAAQGGSNSETAAA